MFPDILGLERALPWLAAAFTGGYLAGSIPFGILVARMFGLEDLRKIGSGNIGATNVLRTGNKAAAGLTLALDLLKGLAAAALGAEWGPLASAAAGAGAAVGHCLPVWLAFRGGKGVATSFGALIIWNWEAAIIALVAWLVLFAALRIASVASLAGCIVAPLALAALNEWDFVPAAVLASLLVIARHKDNIGRLMRGEEKPIRLGSGPRP